MGTQEVANAMDLSFSEEMEELQAPMPIPPRTTRRRELSSSPELIAGRSPFKRGKADHRHPSKNRPMASTAVVETPLASEIPNQGHTAPQEEPTVPPTTGCTAATESDDVTEPPGAATATAAGPPELYIDLSCDHRGRSTTTTPAGEHPGCSMTPAATQTHFVPRLAVFDPRQRASWTLPEVQPDEDVLVVTDSNGRILAQRAPSNWRVASYRGGKIWDVLVLLQHGSIPTHMKALVVAIGINDRFDSTPPMINQLTRLREILSLQRRQVILLSIPYFTEQPHGGATETSAINGMMSEVFEGTDVLVELPESMEMRPFRPNDYAHYSYDSAEQIVRYIRPLLILN